MASRFNVVATLGRAVATFRARAGSIFAVVLCVNWLPWLVMESFVVWHRTMTSAWTLVIVGPFVAQIGQVAVTSLALRPPRSASALRAVFAALIVFPTLFPVWVLGSADSFVTTSIALARPPFPHEIVALAVQISAWAKAAIGLAIAAVLGLLAPVALAENERSFVGYARTARLMHRVRWPFVTVVVAFTAVQMLIIFAQFAETRRPGLTNGEVLISLIVELAPMTLNAFGSVFVAETYRAACAAEQDASPMSAAEVFA